MSSDSGGSQSQTVQSEPWQGSRAYLTGAHGPGRPGADLEFPLQGVLPTAYNEIMQKPLSYYPESTVVPFSGQSQEALQGTESRALAGNPAMNTGQAELQKTLGGEYLNEGNPAYQAMAERAISPLRDEYQNTIMPGIDSQFARAGRYGSNIASATMKGNAADDYMRAVGDVGAGLSYQNYGDERNQMARAGLLAPQYAQQDYTDLSALRGVGQQYEGKAGEQLGEDISRFQFGQDEPYMRLGRMSEFLYPAAGFGGNQTSRGQVGGQEMNPYTTALGAGLTAASFFPPTAAYAAPAAGAFNIGNAFWGT